MSGSFDRTSNQQWEKTHEDSIVDEILFGLNPVFVNVDHIGQSVKCIE